jgi:hypothetical protein
LCFVYLQYIETPLWTRTDHIVSSTSIQEPVAPFMRHKKANIRVIELNVHNY